MSPHDAPVDIDQVVVSPEASVLDTLRTIDRSGLEVALVCDGARKLLSVATDGDIRRFLIRGGRLDEPITAAANPRFTTVAPSTAHAEVAALMIDRRFNCVPVVDDAGRLVDLHTLRATLVGSQSASWAVIMAGGKGERLGELTQAIPKPMLPIGDRPILERLVRHLVAHGVRRIFLSVNHFASMIEDHFGDGRDYFCRIEYLREDRPLGTGGALGLLPERPSAPLLVLNGDLVTSINIARILEFHRSGGFAATMALRDHTVRVPFGVAELDGRRVTRLVEKPNLSYRVNAGIYVLSADVLGRVDTTRAFPITELLDACLGDSRGVGAYPMDEAWTDVGLPEEYVLAQRG